MDSLDVILRVAGGTLLTTLALLVVVDRPKGMTSWLFALFVTGICGFLAGNTSDLELLPSGTAATLADLLGKTAAVYLWLFGLSAFDEEFRPGPVHILISAAWFGAVLLGQAGLMGGSAASASSWLRIVLGVGMVLHLAWRLLRDRAGDLVEGRRRARLVLAGVSAALLLIDLGVDVFLGFGWRPQGFTIAQNATVLVVAVWVVGWLVRADAGLLTFRAPEAARPTVASARPRLISAPPASRLFQRLALVMETECPHRDPDLTFPAFAAKMAASEKEVRRFINQELGHRHFRSFLNSYRLADVRQALADPAKADERIVQIAFDSGFASLASFNRAFKLAEGCSPTEFREARLGSRRAEQRQGECEAGPAASAS